MIWVNLHLFVRFKLTNMMSIVKYLSSKNFFIVYFICLLFFSQYDIITAANNSCCDTLQELVSVELRTTDSIKSNIADMAEEKSLNVDTSSLQTEADIKKCVDEVFYSYIYPIVTLIIGALITLAVSSMQNNRRSRKIGKRWLAELSAIYADIEKQIEAFNVFINEYCNDKDRFDIPDIAYGFINSRNFESLGKEDLYDYLDLILKQNVDETYHKITNTISSLDVIDFQCKNNISQFRDRTSALVAAYNASYNNYRNSLRALPTNSLSIPINELKKLKNYDFGIVSDSPQINIFEIEEKYIKPSFEILIHYPSLSEIIDSLQNCLNITSELRNEKIYIKANFESANKQYENVLNVISEINKTIKSNKSKRFI